MDNYSIATNFSQHFKIKFADTAKLRKKAYQIRYKVYCEELGWEHHNEDKIEKDMYDDFSFHCLLEHRRTGEHIGCIRLIVPPKNSPQEQLPFEKYYSSYSLPEQLLRGSFGELSRLAVLPECRRRHKEKNTPFVIGQPKTHSIFTEAEQRNFPNITAGLYLAGIALIDICNHKGVFVLMETRLCRQLHRIGLPFFQVGEDIDHRGKRALFFLKREDFSAHLRPELSALYQLIYDDLRTQVTLLPFTDVSGDIISEV